MPLVLGISCYYHAIVSSPSDALKTFFASGIDCLALEDVLVEKDAPGDGWLPG